MNGNKKNKDLNQKENGKENENNKNIIDDKKNNKPPQEKITKEKYMTRLPELKGTGCRNVNNYKILEDHIGEGTFGMVFKAEYVGNMDYAEKMGIPKIVALKKIKMEDNKEGFPITALREIMIMKKCHHENLLQILEIVTSKSLVKNQKKQNVYLVFEYMEHDLSGLTLSKYRFELPQIKYIMYQLLKGVQYLHHNNIIHRDIKCANILINNKGQIKIGDFGLARNIIPNHTKEYTYKVVTLWFRAPELLFGERLYGTAIDVWSCGCVFGELLTGKCPFQGKDEEALVNKICEKCGTPNETNWPGVTKLPLYNKYIPRTNFPNSFNETYKNVDNIDEVSLDLFSKMLQLDPKKRITIDEALNHPFFHDHQPSMCTAKEMPKFDREYHEFEYSRHHKKIKEEGQNIAKGDYMNNKEFHNNFLGKKHYPDKNNHNNNRNYNDKW
jgi:cyclin-dependent kinase 12/13